MTSGPNILADKLRAELADLRATRGQATTRKQRSVINKRLHLLEHVLRWFESRAGFVRDPAHRSGGSEPALKETI